MTGWVVVCVRCAVVWRWCISILGNTLVAEGSRQSSSDPLQWVYYGFGGAMY
jgi:hypothetical protein